jgi:hypothetical protein
MPLSKKVLTVCRHTIEPNKVFYRAARNGEKQYFLVCSILCSFAPPFVVCLFNQVVESHAFPTDLQERGLIRPL